MKYAATVLVFMAMQVWGDGDAGRPITYPVVDVAAIRVPTKSEVAWQGDMITCTNDGQLTDTAPFEHKCVDGKRWSCADKTNVLMISEDGNHWCHRLMR